jgi:hypothetical protein
MFRYHITFVPEDRPVAGFNDVADTIAWITSMQSGYGFVPDEDLTIFDTHNNQPVSYYDLTKGETS